MNEKGQILTWQLTRTQGFENIRLLLQQLFWRISSQGYFILTTAVTGKRSYKRFLGQILL